MVARAGRASPLLLAQHRNALRGIQNESRMSEQYDIMTYGFRRPTRIRPRHGLLLHDEDGCLVVVGRGGRGTAVL